MTLRAAEIAAASEVMEPQAQEEVPEETDTRESIPSPEEILRKRVDRKYRSCLKQYESGQAAITSTKRSKREHQQRMAQRRFARNFSDFSDITGDEHIVLQPDLLDYAVTETDMSDDLAHAVMTGAAEYAERNGKQVTSDPRRFAKIIASSLPGEKLAPEYQNILKAIFSTRHNLPDFADIHTSLAEASFELLKNMEALKEIVEISFLRKPYVPISFAKLPMDQYTDRLTDGDYESAYNLRQRMAIFQMLNHHVTGLGYPFTPKMQAAIHSADTLDVSVLEETLAGFDEAERTLFIQTFIPAEETGDQSDPVSVTRLGSGLTVDFGVGRVSGELRDSLDRAPLFRKRMQELAPFAYAIDAAKKILGTGKIQGALLGVSPSVAVEIFLPAGTEPNLLNDEGIWARSDIEETIITIHAGVSPGKPGLPVSSFEASNELHMCFLPLDNDDLTQGIVIVRPAIALDKRVLEPMEFLSAHAVCAKGVGLLNQPPEAYLAANEDLRRTIAAQERKCLGRRPIKFVLPKEITQSGLQSVSLRIDQATQAVKGLLQLHDGQVELTLDDKLRIQAEKMGSGNSQDLLGPFYENLILKLFKHWACAPVVRTSEGVVREGSGVAINLGHFGYQRVVDGKPWGFSHKQAEIYARDQPQRGTTLAQESQRLALLPDAIDPESGLARNSTWYREAYDPSKPPLEVYCAPTDLDG